MKENMSKLNLVLLLSSLLIACNSDKKTTVSPKKVEPLNPPTEFTQVDLQSGSFAKHYPMTMLRPDVNANSATIEFNGKLSFSAAMLISKIENNNWTGEGQKLFPKFSIELISNNETILPIENNLISTWQDSSSFWDIIIGAGIVWQSPKNDGWQRASLPLQMLSRRVGQVRNCLLSFFYNHDDVSNAHIQCDQETSPIDAYQPGDMRGIIPTSYQPTTTPNKARIFERHQHKLRNALPVKPWDDIDSTGEVKVAFNKDLTNLSDQSMGAIIKDGVIYMQDPVTRNGIYPYPNEMRHGVFSVTKSLLGGVSLLYLAERYSDAIFDALITDYVPVLAEHPGWQGVTFAHTVNMATGTQGEDDGDYIYPFIISSTAESGIQAIAQLKDAQPQPGEVFQYASTHSFVLSYAMQQYVQQHEAEPINYWDLVVENVLTPIHAHSIAIQKSEELDGSTGIPTLGWGAFPTIDETAKIAMLLANNGEYNGQQILHRERTRDALGKTTRERVIVDSEKQYLYSFWFLIHQAPTCDFWVPHMSGHGGNLVAFLPSGLITIRFMDQNKYLITSQVKAAELLLSSCNS